MHLMKIAVVPQWRGQGLAARLLAQGMETATTRGATTALLEVRPTNRSAWGSIADSDSARSADENNIFTRPGKTPWS